MAQLKLKKEEKAGKKEMSRRRRGVASRRNMASGTQGDQSKFFVN